MGNALEFSGVSDSQWAKGPERASMPFVSILSDWRGLCFLPLPQRDPKGPDSALFVMAHRVERFPVLAR